jgi:hypothetical protein
MKKCINMYENKFKNIDISKLDDLNSFLNLIADINKPIELFALGGTAMVLKGIKESTKDIDFLTTNTYDEIKKIFILAGLKEKESSLLCNVWYMKNIRIDIFYNDFIFGISLLKDWKILSEHVKKIGKVKLYILNWYDLIITKIARSEERDILDIIDIINKLEIDFKKLKKRYYQIAETSLINNFDEKFKHLEYKIK